MTMFFNEKEIEYKRDKRAYENEEGNDVFIYKM
jgi:hypothetical protein